jgi:hypothetical protein
MMQRQPDVLRAWLLSAVLALIMLAGAICVLYLVIR